MKWILNINKRLVLPILFGISLTTFGLSVAILLYNMFEEDNNKKKNDQLATSKCKNIDMQIRIPEKYVSAIIGKGGTVIKNVEELTNTRIKMEKESLYSGERICHIWSDNVDNIYSAQNIIHGIIQNLPAIETYELFVPFNASRRVFKRNLSPNGFAQKVQRSSGAKVTVENYNHRTADGFLGRRIILRGTADQIALAIIQIEDKVQKEAEITTELKKEFRFGNFEYHEISGEVTATNYNADTCDFILSYEPLKETVLKDNKNVREIERLAKVKIIIDDETECEGNKRKIRIRGISKQIKLALNLIKVKTQDERESQYAIESNSDVPIKISESSSCNNNSILSNDVLNYVLEQDDLMEVFVSAMKTPNLFWIQVIGPANDDLQYLVSKMTEYYNNEENRKLHILKKITIGQMVAVKSKCGDKWYRAEVISIKYSSIYKIFFVDYGDLDIVSQDNIFELRTDMLSLRQQAVECSLANVKPILGDTWSDDAIKKFAALVHLAKWHTLFAKVRSYKKHPVSDEKFHRQSLIPCIDLYSEADKISIAETLTNLEMAQIEEEVQSAVKSLLQSHECNFSFIPFLPDSLHLD